MPYQPYQPYQQTYANNYPYPWGGVTPAPQYGSTQQPAQYAAQAQPPQQPQPQRKPVAGHYVGGESDIAAGDVPMDGSLGVFPAQDGSCIYVRQLQPDFTVRCAKYVPEPEKEREPEHDYGADIRALAQRVSSIEGAISARSRQETQAAAHMREA